MLKNFPYVFFIILSFSIKAQSMQELQKMRAEYEKMKKNQLNFPSNDQILNEKGLDPNIGTPNKAVIGRYPGIDTVKDTAKNTLEHFGYNFFMKRDSVSFWENLPTPKNYLLGPGDELILSLWGETQLRESYIINREGNIYDEKVGLLSMVGKTIEEGEGFIKLKFGNIYSTLRGNNPSTYIDLSLGKLRSINVSFVGNISYPGVYPIHPFSTLITGIIQAGGIDTTGSLREITIKRDGSQKDMIFDFYNFIINGDNKINIQLRDKDIVIIPPRISTVSVDSAVFRPAIYELNNKETIDQLIDYAGGLKPNASSYLSLQRITPLKKRTDFNSLHENFYVKHNSKILTQDGDNIIARFIDAPINKVELVGSLKRENEFNFFFGMSLYDLLKISGLLDEDPDLLKSTYFDKAEIASRNPKSRYESIKIISLHNFINNPEEAKSYILDNLDRLIVHINTNYSSKDPVQISGEVNTPGLYTLSENNENLASLLTRAGGFTSKALSDGVSIYRLKKFYSQLDINSDFTNSIYFNDKENSFDNKIFEGDDNRSRVAWVNDKITLMPGDSVVVKEKSNIVSIFGEVYNPGLLEFQKNKSLRHYINSAGGITEKGSSKKIIVIYANGVVSPNKWYKRPSIKDGVTIIVNKKENREPFDVTQFATNWTSIISSLITAVILSQQLGSS
tara:strand:+ start:4747 stop:6780 length:2034 start_codon:yes stop_codon:yes gene_type:complete